MVFISTVKNVALLSRLRKLLIGFVAFIRLLKPCMVYNK